MNESFIEFLAKSGAIQFGEFTLKSGRSSPFFVNTGSLADGAATYELARQYAAKIHEVYNDKFDAVFGPAYKGIPLAVAITIALQREYAVNKPWIADRKEKKTHGDASGFIGAEIDAQAHIIIVDDVFTTGETKLEAIRKIQDVLQGEAIGLVIAVDRQEKGIRLSAVEEFSEKTGVPVHALTTIRDVFEYLHNRNIGGKNYVSDKLYEQFMHYRKKYH
ncbi:MAG TPA: orotate phosphoribosyltransferase [Candidatus Bilamarchaeaceae archaeon]|nr:orotate phosphoribosyltransferase [Candidatus Bilamarchaeaceae archaeon]